MQTMCCEHVFSVCLCCTSAHTLHYVELSLPLHISKESFYPSGGACEKKYWYGNDQISRSREVTAILCWMWIVLLPVACREMDSSLCKVLLQRDKMIVPCLVWFQFVSQQWCEILTKCQWAITAPQRHKMKTNVTSDHRWKMTTVVWGKKQIAGSAMNTRSFFFPTEQLLTPTLSFWSILYQDWDCSDLGDTFLSFHQFLSQL